MTLDTLIILSGAFVATLPFLGFPNAWDSALFFLAGALIIGLGIVVRRRGQNTSASAPVRETDYAEHIPRAETLTHGQS